MELKNMKMSKEQMKECCEPTAMTDRPEYPYGLCIRLDEESIKKLGITDLPEAGQSVMIMARASVDSVSQRDTQNDGKYRDLSLQITDMSIAMEPEKKDPAETLYSKDDE